MSTSKPLTFAVFAAILLTTLAASVPAAEVVFRLLGDEPSADLRGLYVRFADGNYKHGALVNTDAFRASGYLHVYTDQLGMRCDAARRFGANPGDNIDVLLIGDSQGFGNEVNFEQTIGGTLAEIEAQRRLRVSNASVGGHTLASQFELTRWLVEQQGLKVSNYVLLLTPALINSGVALNRATVGNDGRLYGDTVRLRTRLGLWTKTHSVVYSRVRDAVRNSGIGVEPEKKSPAVFQFYQVGSQREASVASLLAGVRNFQVFAAKHGASVHLVYLPLTVEVDFAPLQQVASKQGIELNPDIPLGICSTVAEHLHIALHNLRPVLEKVHSEGHRLNVKADFHYSPILSQACGSSLASQLELSSQPSRLAANNTEKRAYGVR
jgi:hypothetical protein